MIRAVLVLTLTAFTGPALASSPASPQPSKKVDSGRESTCSFKVAGLTGKGAVTLNASHWQRRSGKAMPTTTNDSE